jgi:hypothetical protein
MSEVAIRAALEAQLATVSGIPTTYGENVAFTAPLREMWIQTALAPQPDQLRTLPARGGLRERRGTWRLLVRAPLDTGTDAVDALVRSILDAFPRGETLDYDGVRVQVEGGRRWRGGRDIDPKAYTVPVDIYWLIYDTNTLN